MMSIRNRWQRVVSLGFVLLVTLISGLGTNLPTAQAQTSAGAVGVRVVIKHIRALDDMEGLIGGPEDFYASVGIDGARFPNTRVILDQEDIHPDWPFFATGLSGIPIEVRVWDSDGPTDADDPVDINPIDGRNLRLLVAVESTRCGIAGEASETVGMVTGELRNVVSRTGGVCRLTIIRQGREDDRAEVEIFIEIAPVVPLELWWSNERKDNYSTGTPAGVLNARNAGYQRIRTEGCVYSSPQFGTTPLKLFWSGERGDNFTTGIEAGLGDALAARYSFSGVEGHVFERQQPGTVPLKLYWNWERGDNFTTATPAGVADALAAGYTFVRVEGYVYPSCGLEVASIP